MKNKSAFTLIELLVSVTITIILFSIGFVSFREFSRRQVLTGAVKTVVSDLRLAQQLSFSGEKPDGVVCSQLLSYNFVVVNASTYRILAVCENANHIVKEVVVGSDIGISASSSTTSFKVLGLGTNLSATNTITITHSPTSRNQAITIGVAGDIK